MIIEETQTYIRLQLGPLEFRLHLSSMIGFTQRVWILGLLAAIDNAAADYMKAHPVPPDLHSHIW